jgi:NAD(P)-dependent dehydrogenase (short-subunit alcohol dehydrogenase family)
VSAAKTRKIALVTGAARGIGRAAATRLAEAGYDLALFDLPGETVIETEAAVKAAKREVLSLAGDVSVETDWIAAATKTEARFGRLDLLVNNAGVSGPVGPLTEVSAEAFDRTLAINARGVFLGMKICAPYLIRTRGAIVNVGSISGLGGGKHTIAYAASKHAVTGMTMHAANELAAHGVRVNAVCPAPTATDMMESLALLHSPESPAAFHKNFVKFIPLGRYGEAGEIAAAITFLASDEAAFITGVALPIDGGALAR